MVRRQLLAAAAWLVAACGGRRDAPPVLGTVVPFELTDETGAAFRAAVLSGKVWVADFIFTTCAGPCPRMSRLMKQVQDASAAAPEVQLVSFTVDPARDTPEVLAAYAKRYQADPARWHFLTGSRETLHRLSRDTFRLGDIDGSLTHSTRLVLVDRKGRIRGYYSTQEDSPVRRLLADIQQVLGEES